MEGSVWLKYGSMLWESSLGGPNWNCQCWDLIANGPLTIWHPFSLKMANIIEGSLSNFGRQRLIAFQFSSNGLGAGEWGEFIADDLGSLFSPLTKLDDSGKSGDQTTKRRPRQPDRWKKPLRTQKARKNSFVYASSTLPFHRFSIFPNSCFDSHLFPLKFFHWWASSSLLYPLFFFCLIIGLALNPS